MNQEEMEQEGRLAGTVISTARTPYRAHAATEPPKARFQRDQSGPIAPVNFTMAHPVLRDSGRYHFGLSLAYAAIFSSIQRYSATLDLLNC